MKKTVKTTKTAKDPVSEAVRDLRCALGESQQAFAYRMMTAIRTIARYETVRPPKGKALADFSRVANETGNQKLASVFADALSAELGPAGQLTALGLLAQAVVPRLRAELADVVNGLRDGSVDAEARTQQAILKLDSITSTLVKKFRPYFPKPAETDKVTESK